MNFNLKTETRRYALNINNLNPNIIKQKFLHFTGTKYFLYTILLLGLLALVLDLTNKPKAEESNQNKPESVDTFIPQGYVLVPIEIQNHTSVDSILGNFGVVDLFTVSVDGKSPSRKIAKKVKIIRAPLDPNQFAVLVKEDNSGTIAGYGGPFYVMIQNPKEQETQFEEKKIKSRIFVEDI